MTIREISRWRPSSRGRVKCSLCHVRIPKGEQYDYITFTDEATLWTWKQCTDCKTVCAAYASEYPYEEIYQENVVDWALDAAKERPHQEVAESFLHRFSTGHRVQLCHLDGDYRQPDAEVSD